MTTTTSSPEGPPTPKPTGQPDSPWYESPLLKALFVFILILILILPTLYVRYLISEREDRQADAIREVSSSWAEAQAVVGPIVSVPFEKRISEVNDQGQRVTRTITEWMHFLPEKLEVTGEMVPEKRYRGMYEVVVYTGEMNLAGHFLPIDPKSLGVKAEDVDWNLGVVNLGLSDLRGIKDLLTLKWGQTDLQLDPGTSGNLLGAGVQVRLDSTQLRALLTDKVDFSLDLSMKGSNALSFVPVGKETGVTLTSSWGTPSFDGAFLPEEREITKDGFTAHWHILHLNRSFPQSWVGSQYTVNTAAMSYTSDYKAERSTYYVEESYEADSEYDFGVRLIVGADAYQKSERSAKYAMLFIVLTFLVFFLVEVLSRLLVHIFQYILVGFALCLFYLLLLSLSEQVGFTTAYGISVVATVGLVGLYGLSIFRRKRIMAAYLAGVLILLYGFIYVLIQTQDYALLMGSIGLFIILAMIMWFTRKVDWYNLRGRS